MKWKKYTIETTTAAEDFMSSMLMELGIEGIEIEDNIPLTKEDQADMFIDFLPELPPDEGISHVSFYIEDDGSDQSDMLRKVKLGLEDLRDTVDVGSGVISSSETEDLDWINNWKKYFSSFTIGDILIKPTWEDVKPEDADKFMIEIDPGISFGTGKHETTQLCIKQLIKYIEGAKEAPTVLDVGCGSGILSIVYYRKDFLNYCLCSHVKHLGFFLLASLAEVLKLCHLSFQTVVKFFYLLVLLVFFLFLEETFLFI